MGRAVPEDCHSASAGYSGTPNLRQELDEKNIRIAVLTLLRYKKLKCIDREPPYGSEVEKEAANEQ